MSNYIILSNEELYHWGIKGMKWGVRRYQNPDGTLTPAGKKRYADDPDRQSVDSAKIKLNDAKRALNKAANRYNTVSTNTNWKRYKEAQGNFTNSKFAYNKAKLKYDTKNEVSRIRDKDVQFTNKSKHRLRLEEQYKKMGMNAEQAQAAANNRIRTEKILAASATVAVAACVAYVARKKYKDRVDGWIKSGEALQRVEMQDTGGKLHDSFFVAKGKHDSKRYENLLGMVRKNQTGHAYLMKLEASSDIKVASKDNATKIFAKLYKNDPAFRSAVASDVGEHFAGRNKIKDINNLSNRNMKKMYENFNANIIQIRNKGSGADKTFYNAMKKAGYGAMQDINDMKYSGYNAKNPLIVFDNAKNNVMVKSVRELTGNLDKKGMTEYGKAAAESTFKRFIERAGPLSAAGLTAAAVSTYRSDPNDAIGNTNNRRVG